MIAKGAILKGMNFIGSPSLGSIGDLKLWLDFRKATETVLDGSDVRLETWTDLRSDLLYRRNTLVQRPLVVSSGLACKVNTENNVMIRPVAVPDLSFLHNGTPHLISMVVIYDNPENLGAPNGISFSTGQNATTPNGQGIGFVIQPSNRLQITRYGDASATAIHNHITAVDTVPENSSNQLLLSAIYYGNGLSNNSKLWIGGSSYTATLTGTLSSAAATRSTATIRGLTSSRLKLITAYNLSGNSVSEIDAFYSNFISTLKLDSEYSSVITS